MLTLCLRELLDLNLFEEVKLCVSLLRKSPRPIRSNRGRYVIKQADIR